MTTAGLARRHNDANVICLGGRTTGVAEAIDAVDTFFSTEFEGGRHQAPAGRDRRVRVRPPTASHRTTTGPQREPTRKATAP